MNGENRAHNSQTFFLSWHTRYTAGQRYVWSRIIFSTHHSSRVNRLCTRTRNISHKVLWCPNPVWQVNLLIAYDARALYALVARIRRRSDRCADDWMLRRPYSFSQSHKLTHDVQQYINRTRFLCIYNTLHEPSRQADAVYLLRRIRQPHRSLLAAKRMCWPRSNSVRVWMGAAWPGLVFPGLALGPLNTT